MTNYLKYDIIYSIKGVGAVLYIVYSIVYNIRYFKTFIVYSRQYTVNYRAINYLLLLSIIGSGLPIFIIFLTKVLIYVIIVCMGRIYLNTLAQAIEDILRYELGLPLIGISDPFEQEEAYEEALCHVAQFPSLRVRSLKLDPLTKHQWLKELENARF